ncbi:bifunctional folylpolyglutamate synthase/dihydrofolate synthase [Candidatus Micrarchaeota archaeon]|nr:bifunctional folylpolyglutamate synthase/dihydrofolate synthase [Candidatus Micrarchaeota archaeon]
MAGKGQAGSRDDITSYLQSLNRMGAKLGLERVTKLLDALDRPQDSFRTIIVGGTSGKGSTAAMISSVLTEAGYKTGRYTSPHLTSITERIVVDGKEISESDFARMITKVREAVDRMAETQFDHPTFFEVVTAAAFCYFREKRIDFAVLEVGLGGRLDATNTTSDANTPVSVITNISLEHTTILGDTIAKIAYEKAGIIKQDGILVTAAQDEALGVFEKACNERNARMFVAGKDIVVTRVDADSDGQVFDAELAGKKYAHLHIPLLGRHQLENAACAIGAVEALGLRGVEVDDGAMTRGLKKTKWPGRMEIVQKKPRVMLDGAKDAEAMRRLWKAIEEDMKYRRLVLVIGISSDKDIDGMVGAIAPLADKAVITAHNVAGRAADMQMIADSMKKHGVEHVMVPDVKDAVKKAISLADEDDLVLVTGSLFTVAEARELWHKTKTRWGRELSETPKK